ncbi:uncharacterized protein LTR77_003884 [Saxophila tyrrhenica]|uniref:DNA mismatch repair protein S5 domain-containing protein n=1 Tax=Saxophila tyrrhenica TaxID=1690608 RepID=A0AAV9PIC0_9PEZI|nr:hypothetical protein LTR77_003884 [Saxophila tyrrhenica]
MGIQALPQTTIRTLGSTQVLTDPASVVKELIDNALDAHATSISVEISTNTLDLIQVRDNGHGIPPEDRLLVARPHCTSKIGSEEDLKDIGGSSLGFGGEALASVAEVSGSLTISTRVEGEQVATAMKINRQGEVTGQDRASLPVGTTIKVTDFIKSHPVRRQVALKATEKTLKKIKQLLQSDAFARPQTRIALRILKAKHDKGNWMYAPKPGGNAEDAAFKVVGAACASQCTWSVVEENGFSLHAFLPRADADTTSRGVAKQLAKTFKQALSKAGSPLQGAKELFIFLEIKCPPASYDANVEPAKDDVLFEDPEVVVTAARRLFEAVYPAQPEMPNSERMSSRDHKTVPHLSVPDEEDFTSSLEPRRATSNTPHPPSPESAVDRTRGLFDLRPARQMPEDDTDDRVFFRSNMYGCDEEDPDLPDARPPTGRTEADFEELRQARKDINVSNPWVMAKLHTSVRRPAAAEESSGPAEVTPTSSNQRRIRGDADDQANALPTPGPSSPSVRPNDFHPSDHVPGRHFGRDGRMIESQMLPPPLPYMRPSSPMHLGPEGFSSPPRERRAPGYNYALPLPEQPVGTPLSSIPEITPRARRSPSPKKQLQQTHTNRPFVSPLQREQGEPEREKVWFDHLERIDRPRRSPVKQGPGAGLVTQGELGDLTDELRPLARPKNNRDMRDFVQSIDLTQDHSAASIVEGRDYPASKRGQSMQRNHSPKATDDSKNAAPADGAMLTRGFMPASELADLESHVGGFEKSEQRPTKRRRTSEGRVLREVSSNARAGPEGVGGDDDENDPNVERRKTAQRRRTTDGNKVGRGKSSRLPLERTPAGQGTHNIVSTFSTTARAIANGFKKIDQDHTLLNWEVSADDTNDAFASVKDSQSMSKISDRLHELLINRLSDGEMVQDLGELVRDALMKHGTTEDNDTPIEHGTSDDETAL